MEECLPERKISFSKVVSYGHEFPLHLHLNIAHVSIITAIKCHMFGRIYKEFRRESREIGKTHIGSRKKGSLENRKAALLPWECLITVCLFGVISGIWHSNEKVRKQGRQASAHGPPDWSWW